MLKLDDQSTTALHFVQYLETPPSTNGIPSLASLLQVYSTLPFAASQSRCSTWSFATFRSHTATSLGTRTGLLLFFPHLPYGTGDKTRILGLSWSFRDTWQLCGLLAHRAWLDTWGQYPKPQNTLSERLAQPCCTKLLTVQSHGCISYWLPATLCIYPLST